MRTNNKTLAITISGLWNAMNIGKNVIRILGKPEYITIAVNKKRDSIIICPGRYSDLVSYKVPDELYTDNHKIMRVNSKGFSENMLSINNLDSSSTYSIYGEHIAEKNCVRFDFCNAFENRMNRE